MEKPGQYLKKERELRGVSIEKVSQDTRLPLEILERLEADDFPNLPHKTFVRGYIKSYCKELGLDATEALLRHEQLFRDGESSGEVASRELSTSSVFVSEDHDKSNPVGTYGATFVAFASLLAFLYFFMGNIRVEEKQTATVDEVQISKDSKSPILDDGSGSMKVLGKAEGAPLVEMAKQERVLHVKAESTTWISVEIDPGTEKEQFFEVTMEEGDEVTWKASKVFFWS